MPTTIFKESSYKTVSLGSLCVEEPCYGTSATAIERIDESQPKYIRITDFDDFGIEPNHIFTTAAEFSEKHILKKGDLLFARSGATVGKTYYYDGKIGAAIFAGYCIRFRFDIKKVLPKYVYWYTKSNNYLRWVKNIQRPSGQPNINKEEYKSCKIILPDIQIQEKLISYLDAAAQKRIEKLHGAEDLLIGMNNYILSVLGIVMPNFDLKLCSAVKLADIKTDKTLSANYYHPERIATIHMIKSSTGLITKKLSEVVEFHRDIVDSSKSDFVYLGLAGVESSTGELSGIVESAAGQAFVYKKGDVLYGRLRPYLNKVLYAEENGICSTEFHVMRIIDEKTILPEYLAAIMRSDIILSQTRHMMTGNTHPRISNDDVKNLYIPVPPIAIQREIVKEVQLRRQKARKLKHQAEREWLEAKTQFERELLGE
jgi:restriction endonuclease S subunit